MYAKKGKFHAEMKQGFTKYENPDTILSMTRKKRLLGCLRAAK
jgi:hypothetical protein